MCVTGEDLQASREGASIVRNCCHTIIKLLWKLHTAVHYNISDGIESPTIVKCTWYEAFAGLLLTD